MKEQGAEAYFKERYKDRIQKVYSESREISLMEMDGWDAIDFAESYHRHRLESITEGRIEEMANRCFPDIPHMGDLTMTNRIKWTGAIKGMKALLDYLKQPR